MSIAGIYSNQGDEYQIINAIKWMIDIIADQKHQHDKIEIDSTSLEIGDLILVDDIVIYRTDKTKICCQYKKNAPNHKSWTIRTLKEELLKAGKSFSKNPTNQYIFGSRTDFGDLKRLEETAKAYPNEEVFIQECPQNLIETLHSLQDIFHPLNVSVYTFLQHSSFQQTLESKDLEILHKERLQNLITNTNVAYSTLFKEAHKLWSKTSSSSSSAINNRHSLTRKDLLLQLQDAGVFLLTLQRSEKELKEDFTKLSSIGIQWRRDIAGQIIAIKTIAELSQKIKDITHKTIVLTGNPGSGKTCVLLTLKETLEQEPTIQTIFIQSRSFESCQHNSDLERMGLDSDFVEKVAQMANYKKVALLIDSLDVLSITKNHQVFDLFLSIIDRLKNIHNVITIIACRDFDYHYDHKLCHQNWHNIRVDSLDWENDIYPLLQKLNYSTDISESTKNILTNPLYLALYVELEKKPNQNFSSTQFLLQHYIEHCFQQIPHIEHEGLNTSLEAIANKMLVERKTAVMRSEVDISDLQLQLLCSHGIIQKENNKIIFRHQIFLDLFNIKESLRKSIKLKEFILSLLPLPFVRPTIREYTLHIATFERENLCKHLRAVIADEKVAYHLKRLVIEVFASLIPQDNDWGFINWLRNNHQNLFNILYYQKTKEEWFEFWDFHLSPIILEENDQKMILHHCEYLEKWSGKFPKKCLLFWEKAMMQIIDKNALTQSLYYALAKFKSTKDHSAKKLIEQLYQQASPENQECLGEYIYQLVISENDHEDLLYSFIFDNLTLKNFKNYSIFNEIRYGKRYFRDTNILSTSSHFILTRVLRMLKINARKYQCVYGYNSSLLFSSSYRNERSVSDRPRRFDNSSSLIYDLEEALQKHIIQENNWWTKNKESLIQSKNLLIIYIIIQGLLQQKNIDLESAFQLLTNKSLLKSSLDYELSILLKHCFLNFTEGQQDTLIKIIESLSLKKDRPDQYYETSLKVLYSHNIPGFIRSQQLQEYIFSYEKEYGIFKQKPNPTSYIGCVKPPIPLEILIEFSNKSLLQACHYFEDLDDTFSFKVEDELIGGKDSLAETFRAMAEKDPLRFLEAFKDKNNVYQNQNFWDSLPLRYKPRILSGIANNILYRKNILSNSEVDKSQLKYIDDHDLFNQITVEVNQHSYYWFSINEISEIFFACSFLISNEKEIKTLLSLLVQYEVSREEVLNSIEIHSLNSAEGRIAQTILNIAIYSCENTIPISHILKEQLYKFSTFSETTQISLLKNLHVIQYYHPELGWDLLNIITNNTQEDVWVYGENCLYHSYHHDFERVDNYLKKTHTISTVKGHEMWGRIMALAQLSSKISIDDLLRQLDTINNENCWFGAIQVWSHNENIKKHKTICFIALHYYLKKEDTTCLVLQEISHNLFDTHNQTVIKIPLETIKLFFNHSHTGFSISYRFNKWLIHHIKDIDYVYEVIQIVLDNFINYKNDLSFSDIPIILTALFKEAEDREFEDEGEMLKKVIDIQDKFYQKSPHYIHDWLAKAER